MRLEKLRVEYRERPIGLDERKPRFSWVIKTDKPESVQSSYQIQVFESDDVGVQTIVWDSGKVESDQSVLVVYEGEDLKPETCYEVKIHVWSNQNEEAEETTCFETGLLCAQEMQAEWIAADIPKEEKACPVFVRQVKLKGKVRKARLYATAHGLYDVYMNGSRVGDAYFTPGWTSYQHRLQYQTYDVTDSLQDETKVEVTVADGWYKGPFGFALQSNIYGNETAVLAELHITYETGEKEIIGTDKEWKVTTGVIRESQIYYGETVDSTYDIEESDVWPVKILSIGKTNLVGQEGETVRIVKRTPAQKLIVTPKGELVLDFGQNIAGFAELHVQGKKGQRITVYHAETLDKDGNFYPETLRQAISVDTYICDGTKQIFTPRFTFHGFRYIRIEGLEQDNIVPEDFIACTVHSDMEKTGDFSCSNKWINQLQSNIKWGMYSNFLDVPTDCPQRDERLGWTGDAQIFAATASYLCNTALFYKKWLRDLKAEQTEEFGVPHVIPNILGNQPGAAAWSDAATVIPWVVYETFGDIRVLEEQFDSMKGWVDYITRSCGENGLWQSGFQYGDWLALDKEESADRTGATDKYLVANAYYAYSCEIVMKAAKVLGKKEEEKQYAALYEKIKASFNEEYITRTGRLVSETQTGCILALHFRLAEERYRKRILESLKQNIEIHKNHLATGFVGTPYMCHVLSENENHDLAGTIFMQEDYPSWLYAVKKGATTIWERWNSIMPDGSFDESGMNSLNHYAYGSIGEWMYKKILGINLIEPGYKRFLIRPMFVKGITHAEGSFESVYGTIRSAWHCEDGTITVDITVPANTTAEIYLPEKEEVLIVGSGTYHYEYVTETDLKKDRFSMDSTLQQILQEPLAVELFNQYVPGMLDGPMIQFAYQMTLAEMCAVAPDAKALYSVVLQALNQQEI